jgi:hypothetical protein
MDETTPSLLGMEIVAPFKFAAGPHEYKVTALRECPTPESLQLCDTPDRAAEYWRLHVPIHPYFNADCECFVVLMLNTHRNVKRHHLVSIGTLDTILVQAMCSQRQACRFLKLARSTYGYRGRAPTAAEEQLRKRLVELSLEHPRYGYRRIAALLRREGWKVGKRHIQRLRRAAGLRVPPTKRKIVRRGISTGLPTTAMHKNHVWTWDFIADATVRGGALKMLTILDEHTRECPVLADSEAGTGRLIGPAWPQTATSCAPQLIVFGSCI